MTTSHSGLNALTAADRTRLAKLLGPLGSSQAGERGAAGLAVHRLIQQRGAGWMDVLTPRVEYLELVSDETTRSSGWRQRVGGCLGNPARLTDWETGFLNDVFRRRKLTPRQQAVLDQIAERVPGGR